MLWLLTVGRRSQEPVKFWGVSPVLSLLLLSGCSLEPEKVSLSQQALQQAVNVGFLAPQIRTFDLQPMMVIQIYLDTPSVTVGDENGMVKFIIEGRVDAQILGGHVTEELPITVFGQSGLAYDTGERAIYMNQVELKDTLLDLDVDLFRAMILSKFQSALAREMEGVPLISLAQTPELEERLVELAEEGAIQIKVDNGNIIFQHAHR